MGLLTKRNSFITHARAAVSQFYCWGRVAREALEIYRKRD